MNRKVTLEFHDANERPKQSTTVLVYTNAGFTYVLNYSKKFDAFNVADDNSEEQVQQNNMNEYIKFWTDLEEINL